MSSYTEHRKIGVVAKQLGISTRTIRYYEEIGLLGDAGRCVGGTRKYTESEILRLKFILKLKNLGIKLSEMKELAVNYDLNNQEQSFLLPHLLEMLDFHKEKINKKTSRLEALYKDISDYQNRILEMMKSELR